MSTRSDIRDGTNQDNLKLRDGLIYTRRCGWIDLGHLNPYNRRSEIGAANLWQQILSEKAYLKRKACRPATSAGNHALTIAHHLKRPKECETDPEFRFPNGIAGFKVIYRQDHAGYPGRPGRQGIYAVQKGLTLKQKQQVALAIMMEVSLRFERLQLSFPAITDSGFSQEDLVSNLIGYYIGIGEIDQITALKACEPVSKAAALEIWDNDGSVGQNKNFEWTPRFAKKGINKPKGLPDQFRSIKPAKKGILFQEIFN